MVSVPLSAVEHVLTCAGDASSAPAFNFERETDLYSKGKYIFSDFPPVLLLFSFCLSPPKQKNQLITLSRTNLAQKNSKTNTTVSENGYISCGAGRTSNPSLVNGISNMWMAEVSDNNIPITYSLMNDGTAFNGAFYQRFIIPTDTDSINSLKEGTSRYGLANYGLNCQLGE